MADNVIRIGCDFSAPAIENSALLARDFTFCGRYIGVNPELAATLLTLSEAELRTEAGLDLFSIYEAAQYGPLNGYPQGVTDGNDALAGARLVHQPPVTPIYFSADWDVPSEDYDAIEAYLAGAASVVAPTYTVGLYSSYDALSAMAERGAAQFFWQSESTSFSEGRNATQNPNDDLWQHLDTDSTFPCPPSAGPLPCIDDDDALQAFFGQWRAPLITTNLIMAWRGAGSDESIWWTTFDGRTWQPQQKVPVPGSSASPALALLDASSRWPSRGRAWIRICGGRVSTAASGLPRRLCCPSTAAAATRPWLSSMARCSSPSSARPATSHCTSPASAEPRGRRSRRYRGSAATRVRPWPHSAISSTWPGGARDRMSRSGGPRSTEPSGRPSRRCPKPAARRVRP
jgi:hypothetical protein